MKQKTPLKMLIARNPKNWPLTADAVCDPLSYPGICFSRNALSGLIKKYRAKCRKAGIRPSKLTIRQA